MHFQGLQPEVPPNGAGRNKRDSRGPAQGQATDAARCVGNGGRGSGQRPKPTDLSADRCKERQRC
jgi:hypothetical protein